MATTRQRSQMSAVCVPSGRFSSDALDASASTYTETGLDVGVPVAVSDFTACTSVSCSSL